MTFRPKVDVLSCHGLLGKAGASGRFLRRRWTGFAAADPSA
jgi:hypothetical protein